MYAYYSPSDCILQQKFSFFSKSSPLSAGKIDIPLSIMYNKMMLIMSANTGILRLKSAGDCYE